MNFIEIRYFANKESICADDFKNKSFALFINWTLISSVYSTRRYRNVFSGRDVDDSFVIKMSNGNTYHCKPKDCELFLEFLNSNSLKS